MLIRWAIYTFATGGRHTINELKRHFSVAAETLEGLSRVVRITMDRLISVVWRDGTPTLLDAGTGIQKLHQVTHPKHSGVTEANRVDQ